MGRSDLQNVKSIPKKTKLSLYQKVKIKQNFVAYAFLVLPMLLLSIFTFFPLLQGIYISFLDYNIMNNPTVGGPLAFIKAFAGNLPYVHNYILSLALFFASIIILAVLIRKKFSAKVIWLSLAGLLIVNLIPLGNVVIKSLQDINYAVEEDRTISNDLVPRYIEMIQDQYGADVPITKEAVNNDETRVFVKRSTWVGTKFYRAIITNQPYVNFIKKNVWYFFLMLGWVIGLVLLRFLKNKVQRHQIQNSGDKGIQRYISILKGFIILDVAVFAIISWVQIFNSQAWSFYQALRNSLVYILVVPPIQVAAVLLAILVNQKIKGITFFRTLFYVPVITGVVIIGYCWKFIYQPNGLLDATLAILRMEPLAWLGDVRIALFSIMFVTFWRGLGYYMVLYLAGIQDISNELLEAAKIDGASGFQLITRIYIPLLRRTILVCTVLSTIAALRVFEEIYVLSGGSTGAAPMNGTQTMVYMIFDKAFGMFGLQFSYSAALAVILSIFIGLMTIVNFKLERGYDK